MRRTFLSIRAALVVTMALLALSFAARPTNSAGNSPATPAASAAQAAPAAQDQGGKAAELAPGLYIEPDDLAKALANANGDKPLILHVGFRNLYNQAFIPGAEYQGPGSKPEGLDLLRKRVASLPKGKYIVIYCGCCPWDHCPNMKPAYDALHAMGFTNVKVLHVENNFKVNWMDKGYPVDKSISQ